MKAFALIGALTLAVIGFIAGKPKKASASTPSGEWKAPPIPANAPGGTPAGTPALTPYGAGTYQPDGTVILPNGTIINPQSGEVKPPPVSPAATTPPPVPSSDAKPDTGGIPARIGERMARALATGDPVAIRAEAAALRKDGYPMQADQLLSAALLLESAKVIPTPVVKPVPAPAPAPAPREPTVTPEVIRDGGTYVVQKGDSPYKIAQKFTGDGARYKELATANPAKKANILAGKIYTGETLKLPATWVVPPVPSAPPPMTQTDPRKELAIKTQLMLMSSSAGREDKALVKTYQAANQPDAGAIDGLYGPKTAVTNIPYGLVPVTPYYWPKATMTQAKRDYKNRLLAEAVKDPVRAQEWQRAADNVR